MKITTDAVHKLMSVSNWYFFFFFGIYPIQKIVTHSDTNYKAINKSATRLVDNKNWSF